MHVYLCPNVRGCATVCVGVYVSVIERMGKKKQRECELQRVPACTSGSMFLPGELLELLRLFYCSLSDLLKTFYQRALSPFRAFWPETVWPFKAILPKASVAVRAVLGKASGFLWAALDDQNTRLKTKRNRTNQYRPQWGMKQLAERSWGEDNTHTHTHKHTHTHLRTNKIPSQAHTFTFMSTHIWTQIHVHVKLSFSHDFSHHLLFIEAFSGVVYCKLWCSVLLLLQHGNRNSRWKLAETALLLHKILVLFWCKSVKKKEKKNWALHARVSVSKCVLNDEIVNKKSNKTINS